MKYDSNISSFMYIVVYANKTISGEVKKKKLRNKYTIGIKHLN